MMFYLGVTVRGSSQIARSIVGLPLGAQLLPPLGPYRLCRGTSFFPCASSKFAILLSSSAVSMTFRVFSRTLVIFSPSDGVIFPEPMLRITRWLAATASDPVLVGPNRICTAGSRRAGVIRSMQAARQKK